jgi:transcriptional regulatory protein RtcR
LRGDTAGSALFGHVRGAFTGAADARPGLLKSADGGLLFLDEIGELGLDEQAMLLRAIEDKRFLPMGSDKEVASEFQLLAGTNRDLTEAVQAGRFREDLFARLNLWTFYLPGLKERSEDIEPNIEFELARFAQTMGEQVRFNSDARARYLQFAQSKEASWPGNFRDLGASMTRLATLSTSGRIGLEAVDEEITRLRRLWGKREEPNMTESSLAQALGIDLQALDRFDRAQLQDVLQVCKQSRNLSEAGRTLFQASRVQKTSSNDADRLKKYLAKFGVNFEQIYQTHA